MKDHEKRELVNELVAIAHKYSLADQLRDRIAYALSGVFSDLDDATARAERAEVELKQEPVATVYIGSGHCKVAFTDAAKEAMTGRQGQSFDVYADPMLRAVKESLTAESMAAQVPQEWRDFAASVAENKLLQPDCVCERCEWTRTAIALLQEVKS